MKTILFQGDSITDADRLRDVGTDLGKGYPLLVGAELGLKEQGYYRFINKGISGNRVVDLYARIKSDIINLNPDIMSILIGVNDVWHGITSENGVDENKYFKIYSMLIEEIKSELPNIKIMLMEPFVLQGTATIEKWELFRTEVEKRAKRTKEISEKYGLVFVPLQEEFDIAVRDASPDYWLQDGVHPTPAGHEIIKRAWINAFENSLK